MWDPVHAIPLSAGPSLSASARTIPNMGRPPQDSRGGPVRLPFSPETDPEPPARP